MLLLNAELLRKRVVSSLFDMGAGREQPNCLQNTQRHAHSSGYSANALAFLRFFFSHGIRFSLLSLRLSV